MSKNLDNVFGKCFNLGGRYYDNQIYWRENTKGNRSQITL